MARVKGRDVVLELMESVAALEKTSAVHATQLSELAALAMETSARAHGLTAHTAALSKGFSDLSRRMDDMSSRMADMSKRMDDMSGRMDDMSGRMDHTSKRTNQLSTDLEALTRAAAEFEAGLITQAEQTKLAAQTAHQQSQQLGRVSRLLVVLADGTDSRFDEIESRLVVLEKKTG